MPICALLLSALGAVTVANAAAVKRPGITPPPYGAYRAKAHRQLANTGADCFDYAVRAYDLLRAKNIPVRLVVVAASDNDYDTHTFIEVKVRHGWAIQDPTFDGWWSIDGHAAGAADLQDALAHRRLGAVRWHGPAAAITKYYVNPLLLFRTVRYESLDSNDTAVVDGARTVSLPLTYYAVRSAPGSVAQVMVIHGGTDWRVGTYPLMPEPDDGWVSPIGFLGGLPVTGQGSGRVELLSVPRLPAAQVAG